MFLDYDNLINAINDDEFEERPVDIEEFVSSPNYLNMKVDLSKYQYQLVKASTQIYKKSTLINLHGEEEGLKRWSQTCKEVIFQLGKGAGKDFTSTVAVAYIVYLLLCLKDPAVYYGKEPGDTIDILNVAINAQQAQNVFFNGFKQRIKNSPWFTGKCDPDGKKGQIEFIKSVNVFSGHSERESWEGYNFLYVVLDEISGFAVDSNSGNESAKTASAIYKMYRGSVTSRFPDFGKLVLLSFPRYKDDFIQTRYNEVVVDKEVIVKHHTFKLDPALPDGTEGNEFEIEWEEDHIIGYNTPGIYALKRPSWDVNPNRHIDEYTRDFYDDPQDALMRFACMPPMSLSGFFKDAARVDEALCSDNGVDENGNFRLTFLPQEDKTYYIHVDLARKHDRCVVSMSHVERWEQRNIAGHIYDPTPIIKVDAIRYWTPKPGANVDFVQVREYIVDLRKKGFNIRLVTFDRWESDDMIQYLNGIGIKAEKLSVAINHYTDLAMVVAERRLIAPKNDILRKELLQLRIMPNGKLDHPRSGSKDLADSMCGSVYNTISHTSRRQDQEIEILTPADIMARSMQEDNINKQLQTTNTAGPIRYPQDHSTEMPPDLLQFLRVI